MKAIVLASFAGLALVACSKNEPVADGPNNAAAADVSVLPADESPVAPTNELEGGAAEAVNSSFSATPPGKIPASLHGRWGMTPGDCMSTRGDEKGLLIVSADGLKFYESVAKPAGELDISPDSASGDFAFTGEGMTWKKFEALEVQHGKLVRTESDPMTSFTYARCTS